VHDRRRASGLCRWLALWVLFSLLGALWALASPLFSVPDEPAHAVYAAGAVRGEVWEPGKGHDTKVEVPADLEQASRIPQCFAFRPDQPAGCGGAYLDEPGTAEIATSAGRYPPVYYVYAGLGTVVSDGATAVYLMRALTAVAVGALLASATCSVLEQRRRTATLLGLGLSATPMLFFFAGAINPQAPEIAASILLWVSGAALLQTLREDPRQRLRLTAAPLRRVVTAVVVLSLARPLSLLWIALIVACLLVALATGPALRALLSSGAFRLGAALSLVTGGFTLFWVIARDSLLQQDVPIYADLPLHSAVLISMEKSDNEFREMIGVFGWRDTDSPGVVYVVFTVLLGVLLLMSLNRATARQLLAVATLAAGVVLLPPVLELREYQSSAFAWQGRYTLPIAVGVPLLLGFLADQRSAMTAEGAPETTPRHARRVVVLFAVGLVVVHVAAFLGALNRNVHGVGGFWFVTKAGWVPPLPVAVLVLLEVAACVVLAVLLARASLADVDRPRTDGRPPGPGLDPAGAGPEPAGMATRGGAGEPAPGEQTQWIRLTSGGGSSPAPVGP
jgi:hypothetical protein